MERGTIVIPPAFGIRNNEDPVNDLGFSPRFSRGLLIIDISFLGAGCFFGGGSLINTLILLSKLNNYKCFE